MNDKEYSERQYREDVKKAALIQMDAFKQATSNPKHTVQFVEESCEAQEWKHQNSKAMR